MLLDFMAKLLLTFTGMDTSLVLAMPVYHGVGYFTTGVCRHSPPVPVHVRLQPSSGVKRMSYFIASPSVC
jgi:hypothetical protein